MKPVQANTGPNTEPSLPHPKKKSHKQQILEYLQNGGRLTFFKSSDLFGCRALAQRVSELRMTGHRISDEWVNTPDGADIKQYFIEQPNTEGLQ
jgi:hypothetical protein